MKLANKKILVAFFSRKGQNYVSGRIVDLEVGNTGVVADMSQKIVAAICSVSNLSQPIPKTIQERQALPRMNCVPGPGRS